MTDEQKDEAKRMGDRFLEDWRRAGSKPCVFCHGAIPRDEPGLLIKVIHTLHNHVYFYAHYRCFNMATKTKLDDILRSQESPDGFYLAHTD